MENRTIFNIGQVKEEGLHSSIRIYPNGDKRYNGVRTEHLEDHINYNREYRFGCDLIIDGKVAVRSAIYIGKTREDFDKRNEEIIKELETKPHNPQFCTVPYK